MMLSSRGTPSISPTATSNDADPQSHDLLTIAITINGLVGYAWVLEQTEHHGYHIHAVFYLNGQKHRQVSTVFETLRDTWKYVTWEEGHTHRYEPKERYRLRGEWVTAYDDIKCRKNMQYILSYLSKQEQKTLGVICQLSDIPAPPGAGRRRKAS
ncbi:inovirus-type Gp2 protein [Raoultella ornithinolytica]|uniref:inovirus-type Gp2 protein n=1 Tax=Enterobacterales TaxID=91347 RepID=UPI0009B249A8|nr:MULTISPECIES: inovirus-type Gp2 protein [Enterobacterales]MDM3196618.1 inovirus Gp2 family protein [Citrobacter sp. Cf095]